MDILNWVYLLKNKLVKKEVQDPKQDLVILGNNVSYVKRGDKYQSYGMTVEDFAKAVGGLQGESYTVVLANGADAVANAAQLTDAYAYAVAATPYGIPKFSENRFTIIAAPGYYDFGSTPFIMDTEYVDLVSLDGNRSIVFNSLDSAGTISITANDVFVNGIDVQNKNFTIANNLTLLKVENCKGGNRSFGFGVTVSGTFTNCTGGSASFGSAGTASGTFTNCVGGNSLSGNGSFGGGFGGVASGIFTNCTAGGSSFGGGAGTASGTFTNCVGTDFPFGTFGTTSGTFTNCTGSDAFGGTLTGKLYYCRLTSGSFPIVALTGVTRLCLDGSNVENNQG